jgi:hypothetical protein
VHVVDYDASAAVQYPALDPEPEADVHASKSDAQLLADPAFHRRNVYAIVMRTLAAFEKALGRRVAWGSRGHQLYVVPHAFADANAFYSREDRALLFGYFPARSRKRSKGREEPAGREEMVYTCLSHDIVALLSVFSLREVVGKILEIVADEHRLSRKATSGRAVLPRKILGFEELARSGLLGLAKQMGAELAIARGAALRRSVEITPSTKRYQDPEFMEPHRRGELLVAAVLRAFLHAWVERIESLGDVGQGMVDRERVVEDGADLADALLSMSIRALDYCPPLELEFPDYLSALLTADAELARDDGRWNLRRRLLESFASFGIHPASDPGGRGLWMAPEHEKLRYHRTHFESMQRDAQELFRFVWENHQELHVDLSAYTQVLSVRPCLRVAPDGFILRETVAEVHQTIDLEASELKSRGIRVPDGMPREQQVTLYGGSTLVFDEYGRLKFEIHKRLDDVSRQERRLAALWADRPLSLALTTSVGRSSTSSRLQRIHRLRASPSFATAPRGELL